ncbi:MAG: DUF1304 domain-containing protein [Pseudomonadota bacterium]
MALIILVAGIHIYILWLEMYAWIRRGSKVFPQFPDEFFPLTKEMAANQGFYNGILAAGLIWSILISNAQWQFNVAMFFLTSIIAAGVFGAFTFSKKIIYVQSLPAALALASLFY